MCANPVECPENSPAFESLFPKSFESIDEVYKIAVGAITKLKYQTSLNINLTLYQEDCGEKGITLSRNANTRICVLKNDLPTEEKKNKEPKLNESSIVYIYGLQILRMLSTLIRTTEKDNKKCIDAIKKNEICNTDKGKRLYKVIESSVIEDTKRNLVNVMNALIPSKALAFIHYSSVTGIANVIDCLMEKLSDAEEKRKKSFERIRAKIKNYKTNQEKVLEAMNKNYPGLKERIKRITDKKEKEHITAKDQLQKQQDPLKAASLYVSTEGLTEPKTKSLTIPPIEPNKYFQSLLELSNDIPFPDRCYPFSRSFNSKQV